MTTIDDLIQEREKARQEAKEEGEEAEKALKEETISENDESYKEAKAKYHKKRNEKIEEEIDKKNEQVQKLEEKITRMAEEVKNTSDPTEKNRLMVAIEASKKEVKDLKGEIGKLQKAREEGDKKVDDIYQGFDDTLTQEQLQSSKIMVSQTTNIAESGGCSGAKAFFTLAWSDNTNNNKINYKGFTLEISLTGFRTSEEYDADNYESYKAKKKEVDEENKKNKKDQKEHAETEKPHDPEQGEFKKLFDEIQEIKKDKTKPLEIKEKDMQAIMERIDAKSKEEIEKINERVQKQEEQNLRIAQETAEARKKGDKALENKLIAILNQGKREAAQINAEKKEVPTKESYKDLLKEEQNNSPQFNFLNLVDKPHCVGTETTNGLAKEGHANWQHLMADDLRIINKSFRQFDTLENRKITLDGSKSEKAFNKAKEALITQFETLEAKCQDDVSKSEFFGGTCIGIDGTHNVFLKKIQTSLKLLAKDLKQLKAFQEKKEKLGQLQREATQLLQE
ncbi:11241_t:CDS:2 [Racocetra fulgida]|uniref:11241_t:CDS:1 n=1 Tax=Racocetra fulgida TaxID=60492 RepID=A0A9N8VGT0_9GLOM|nr:11241_t:CDS:2 [Racocetra fulgida]